jgi:hypothetical protein
MFPIVGTWRLNFSCEATIPAYSDIKITFGDQFYIASILPTFYRYKTEN